MTKSFQIIYNNIGSIEITLWAFSNRFCNAKLDIQNDMKFIFRVPW